MMKKLLLLMVLGTGTWSIIPAQLVRDTVSTQAAYSHQNYYQLATGDTQQVARGAWDLAFELAGQGAGIRVNGANGLQLYKYPHGNAQDWATLDTTGMAVSWPRPFDTDTSWSVGAFNRGTDNLFNLGWGTYSMITHTVVGDSIYVLRLANGSYKKIWIQSLAAGAYNFRHADLDNQHDTTQALVKADYPNHLFAYLSFDPLLVRSLGPNKTDWDLLFTTYPAEIQPGVSYTVSGVLSHPDIRVAQVAQVDPLTADWTGTQFSSDISTIGYDWKSFNMQTFTYDIQDSLVYFVQDQTGNVWRVILEGFGGSSTGDFHLAKQLMPLSQQSASTVATQLSAFPNPSRGQVELLLGTEETLFDAQFSLTDLQGRRIQQGAPIQIQPGLHQFPLSLEGLPNGVYLLTLTHRAGVARTRIVRAD